MTDSTGTSSFTLADDSIDSKVLSDGAAVYRHGVGMFGETRGTTKSYYQADSLGSTVAVTDAFGDATFSPSTGTMPTPFGFAGQYGYQTDADSGLMLLGHRYYDSSTGRFISRDPIQDGDNWYTYCENDPVNNTDPTGFAPPFPAGPGKHWEAEIMPNGKREYVLYPTQNLVVVKAAAVMTAQRIRLDGGQTSMVQALQSLVTVCGEICPPRIESLCSDQAISPTICSVNSFQGFGRQEKMIKGYLHKPKTLLLTGSRIY